MSSNCVYSIRHSQITVIQVMKIIAICQVQGAHCLWLEQRSTLALVHGVGVWAHFGLVSDPICRDDLVQVPHAVHSLHLGPALHAMCIACQISSIHHIEYG